jgi:hypothetical protein
MAKIKKVTHGGKREGAGRPKQPPTKVLSIRVPAEYYAYLMQLVKDTVLELQSKNTNHLHPQQVNKAGKYEKDCN